MPVHDASACPGYRRAAFSRRRLLQVGAAGLLGLSLPDWLRAAGRGHGPTKARAKAVIFLHQFGGPSQFESFDMKPDAPAEIRGEFKPVVEQAARRAGLRAAAAAWPGGWTRCASSARCSTP